MNDRAREMASLVALLRTKSRGETWAQIASDVALKGTASVRLEDDGLFPRPEVVDGLERSTADVAEWTSRGLNWLTVLQPDYPARLREIREIPPFLFYEGTIRTSDHGMSVVGSRNASAAGTRFAHDAARLLVDRGLTVVSGLAEGIDAAAHRSALEANGRTVAVLGTGIDRSYPASNRDLQAEIAERGLLLSQFYPGSPPTKHSFPMRNATMSGYGEATIVVEAGEQSGARIQARVAGEHGRPVILTSWVVESTRWGRELSAAPHVLVVSSLGELATAVDRVIAARDRLGAALSDLAHA